MGRVFWVSFVIQASGVEGMLCLGLSALLGGDTVLRVFLRLPTHFLWHLNWVNLQKRKRRKTLFKACLYFTYQNWLKNMANPLSSSSKILYNRTIISHSHKITSLNNVKFIPFFDSSDSNANRQQFGSIIVIVILNSCWISLAYLKGAKIFLPSLLKKRSGPLRFYWK